jgi:rhamnulokinase
VSTPARLRLAAIDLGAESGRVMVGEFDGDRLSLDQAHRFPNVPVSIGGTLHWDVLRLFGDVSDGLRRAADGGAVASVGVDTWGVDFALLDARGRLLANPVHYRDARTDGMEAVARGIVSREDVYGITGIQPMQINTLIQLFAMANAGDPLLRHADRLLMTADLFANFLCGASVAEYTLASTSQCLDARARDWARPLLERLGIPIGILPEIVPPGTVLGDLLGPVADATGLGSTRVVAPASHDTQSAILGTPLASDRTAFLSSGTWSLLGLEVPDPVISATSLDGSLTNEGAVGGRIALLSNLVGLWLVQESRRALWPAGDRPSYQDLVALAESAPSFTAFIDPDDERFLRPGDLPSRVRAFCAETGQPIPEDTGTLLRVLLESLALRYRVAIDGLGAAVGWPVEGLHIVGGGSSNRLLCQLAADATALPVHAGPVEATALGNVLVQAMAAGAVGSIAEARELVARSFPVVTYEPAADWATARERFAAVTARRTS